MLKFVFIFALFLVLANTEDSAYWDKELRAELQTAKNLQKNEGKAKNIILFLGSGMGPNTVAATRIYRSTEVGKLVFEDFPYMGNLKTYSNDALIPDSICSATALFSGVKANSNTAGVDSTVKSGDCKGAADPKTHLSSILGWAQDANMATGFVSTSRVTDNGIIALYSHIPNKSWECDTYVSADCKDVIKDIARQLFEDEPGSKVNVIMGGGKQALKQDVDGPIDHWTCHRSDGKDLIDTWTKDKESKGVTYKYVENNGELFSIDTDKTDNVLGIFSNQLLPYDFERNITDDGTPSLANMTETAIKVLKKNDAGFFLTVEGSLIDYSHHRGFAHVAIDEANIFNEAIQVALDLMKDDLDETLIVVTANHAQSLTMSGYANRGDNIFGIGGVASTDKVPYTTLNYATGGPNNYQFTKDDQGNPIRVDPSKSDTTAFEYSQQTAINNDQSTHGGADVFVYATGPMAHLFHSLHEQPYVSRVIAYAAGIGPCKDGDC